MNEYVVTIAGPERFDGENPYNYLIDAATPEEAAGLCLRAHLAGQEDDPNFDPATPSPSCGLPSYVIVNVDAGWDGNSFVIDLRGVGERPDRGETALVTWTTTTVAHYQARLPVASVHKMMADHGYDPAATDAISATAWHTDVDQLLAAHEWPATVQEQVVDSRHVEIPDFQP